MGCLQTCSKFVVFPKSFLGLKPYSSTNFLLLYKLTIVVDKMLGGGGGGRGVEDGGLPWGDK